MNQMMMIIQLNSKTAIFALVSFPVDLKYIAIIMNVNYNTICIVSMNIREIQENPNVLDAKDQLKINFNTL